MSTDDTLVTQLITAARMAAEEYLRRALITQTYKLTLDLSCSSLGAAWSEGVYDLPVTELYGGMPRTIELPKGPIQSITSVTTYDLNRQLRRRPIRAAITTSTVPGIGSS